MENYDNIFVQEGMSLHYENSDSDDDHDSGLTNNFDKGNIY